MYGWILCSKDVGVALNPYNTMKLPQIQFNLRWEKKQTSHILYCGKIELGYVNENPDGYYSLYRLYEGDTDHLEGEYEITLAEQKAWMEQEAQDYLSDLDVSVAMVKPS